MSITAEAQQDLRSRAQLCCSVLDSIGGAESYSVSVSWVGSPANVQGFDSVPAPQSQKNLQVRDGKKKCVVKLTKKNKTHLSFIKAATHHGSDLLKRPVPLLKG